MSGMTKAQLEARVAELESELEAATLALTGESPAPVADGPAAGSIVWLQDTGGKTWEVEVGSTPYEMLVANGAQECDAPESE